MTETTRYTTNVGGQTSTAAATGKMGSEQLSEDGDIASTKHGVQSSMSGLGRNRVFDRSQSPKSLMYYPEEMHAPKE